MNQATIEGMQPITQGRKEFKDVRDKREAIAKRRAEILLRLGEIGRRPPRATARMSVQQVNAYLADNKAAMRVAAKPDASVRELENALATLEKYERLGSGL